MQQGLSVEDSFADILLKRLFCALPPWYGHL